MKIVTRDALIDVPWKNGGGTTRNIAKGMSADQVAWTISRADVAQDGPFSDFEGLMRVLTVVSGGEMTLVSQDASFHAVPWRPLAFDGGLKIHAQLQDGPLTDLNLMFDPVHCEGEVATLTGPLLQERQRPDHGLLAYHVLAGQPAINAARLGIGDTVFCVSSDAALKLGNEGALLEIRLTYSDQSDAIRLCIADL